MGSILQPQLVMKILSKFRDQYGGSWINKLLWWLRRVLFMVRSWFFDLEYYTVKKEWLDEFLEYWRNNILQNLHGQPEVFDCDDFSRWFIFKLREYIHNKYGVWYNANGEALGILYKDYQILGGHAWVVVVVDTSDEPAKVMFIEPQIGEYLNDDMTTSDGYMYKLQAVII